MAKLVYLCWYLHGDKCCDGNPVLLTFYSDISSYQVNAILRRQILCLAGCQDIFHYSWFFPSVLIPIQYSSLQPLDFDYKHGTVGRGWNSSQDSQYSLRFVLVRFRRNEKEILWTESQLRQSWITHHGEGECTECNLGRCHWAKIYVAYRNFHEIWCKIDQIW